MSPLDPTSGTTDVLGALRDVSRRFPPGDLGGFLVLSDGVDTATLAGLFDPSGNLLPAGRAIAEGLPGPVVAIAPTQASPLRDVSISRVQGLEYLLTRNLARVEVELQVVGVDGGTVTVTLSEGGQTLARTDVAILKQSSEILARLDFLPLSPGHHVYQVAVEPLPGELSLANNLRSIPAMVVRDTLRILHVAGHASWDERFLREYLKQRKDVELVSFHTLRDDEPRQESEADTTLVPFPAEEIFVTRVEGFDLVLLQDYEIPHPDRARFAESLNKYVRRGGAFLLVGGSKVLGAQGPWPTHLESLLPVLPARIAGIGMSEGSFPVEATPEGRRHPSLSDPRLTQMLAATPALTALNMVGGTTPAALTLLRASPDVPMASAGRPPVLVVATLGEGRTGVLLTDTLWRWSFDPFANPTYRKVMDGMLAYLTKDPSGSSLQVSIQPSQALPGRKVTASIRAAAGIKTVEITLQKRRPDGAFEPPGLSREVAVDEDGNARATLQPTGPGVWRAVASTSLFEAPLVAEDMFAVGPLPAEVGVAEPPLRHLAIFATASKGRLAGQDLPSVESLPFRPEIVARVGVSADEPLWNLPIVFLVILGVLGLEWYVERKIGYT